jgi:hypothetical protein
MTIAAVQFRACVVDPALAALAPAGIAVNPTAADLLVATAAVESQLGTYLRQLYGPARGVFQIQPATLFSTLTRASQAELRAVHTIMTPQPAIDQIDGNLVFAAAIARLVYWRVPAPLPADTAAALWGYYKGYWNTPAGATTESEFMVALKLTDIVFQKGELA